MFNPASMRFFAFRVMILRIATIRKTFATKKMQSTTTASVALRDGKMKAAERVSKNAATNEPIPIQRTIRIRLSFDICGSPFHPASCVLFNPWLASSKLVLSNQRLALSLLSAGWLEALKAELNATRNTASTKTPMTAMALSEDLLVDTPITINTAPKAQPPAATFRLGP